MELKDLIRDIPDFPKQGILFKDITTLIRDAGGFAQAVASMVQPFRDQSIDLVVGVESRGFIFGGAMALQLGCGFVPVRKPGKLPAAVIGEEYTLEYGVNRLELHQDALLPGQRVLIVDDLLATGGTARASANLVRKLGAEVVSLVFAVELSFLDGRKNLDNLPVFCLLTY
jgi:adenine phosphoribosyltransferase